MIAGGSRPNPRELWYRARPAYPAQLHKGTTDNAAAANERAELRSLQLAQPWHKFGTLEVSNWRLSPGCRSAHEPPASGL